MTALLDVVAGVGPVPLAEAVELAGLPVTGAGSSPPMAMVPINSSTSAASPPTLVSVLCRPNHEPSFSSGSQNFQPFGGGGQFAGAFQPSGGVQPGGGAGQLGGGLYFGISSLTDDV